MNSSAIEYDIVIAGGGPAGLTAAKRITELSPNASVLLIEKSSHYSEIVKCGEGVWKKPFEELITPRPEWIRLNITKASFHSPNNKEVIFSDQGKVLGYILDRIRFQEELLEELCKKIEVKRSTAVKKVSSLESKQIVELSDNSSVSTKLFIDASGPVSTLGTAYGIERGKSSTEPALYAIVEGISQRSDTVHLQMSSKYSPGGYVWLFPVSENVVNVGIVCGRDELGDTSMRDTLREYITEFIPEGKIVSWHGGAIPSFTESKNLVAPGFIQCGDAGRLVNPITRSGISESMLSGKLAGEAALEAILSDDNGKKALKNYTKSLHKEYTSKMEKIAKVRKSLYKISDKEFNDSAEILSSLPQEKITMLKILQTTITKSPKLLLAMRHLL